MKNLLTIIILSGILTSCGSDFNKPYSDTPTAGKVNIAGDETLEPLMDAISDTFMGLYQYASINATYKSESDCFQDLLNDSVKVILATRKLNNNEIKYFESKQLIPVTTKIAIDAIALIINRENYDSLLSVVQLKSILEGKIGTWAELHPTSPLGPLSFVFDNNGSSTMRFISDSLMNGKTNFPSFCFAAKSNEQVIDYVEKNKNAIGVIGVNWISDRDDPKMLSFNNRIRVVWLSKTDQAVYPDDFFGPFQAYLYTGDYPLKREVYMISREGRMGLGTGFVSFAAGEQGQRIVRLSGLLPASPYTRDIKLN
ncbi:MAG: substrate-binding domain-containing protein [Bacteroidetes bacterium]|nr:substrate-binding domain-containing protein [Bacteroidota bacterium]